MSHDHRLQLSKNASHVQKTVLKSKKKNLKKLHQRLSTMMAQEAENEMAMMELDILAEPAGWFNFLGSALLHSKSDLEESRQIIEKRLSLIRNEKERLLQMIGQAENERHEFATSVHQRD